MQLSAGRSRAAKVQVIQLYTSMSVERKAAAHEHRVFSMLLPKKQKNYIQTVLPVV